MNIHEHEVTDTDVLFNLKGRHIYGSSSLGIKMDTLNMFTATFSNTISTVLGRKYFHLSNHLSNNLTTINDIKIPVSSGTTIDYYDVGIVNIYGYYLLTHVQTEVHRLILLDSIFFSLNK